MRIPYGLDKDTLSKPHIFDQLCTIPSLGARFLHLIRAFVYAPGPGAIGENTMVAIPHVAAHVPGSNRAISLRIRAHGCCSCSVPKLRSDVCHLISIGFSQGYSCPSTLHATHSHGSSEGNRTIYPADFPMDSSCLFSHLQ